MRTLMYSAYTNLGLKGMLGFELEIRELQGLQGLLELQNSKQEF